MSYVTLLAVMIPHADFHMHTHHSGDSEAPMEQMIRSALGKGLTAICFTEHLDLSFPGSPPFPDPEHPGALKQEFAPDFFLLDATAYREEFLLMKERFGDLISLGFGCEIGLTADDYEASAGFIAAHPFDFVIASTHVCDGIDVFYKEFYEGRPVRDSVKRYFEATLENILSFDDFDVYGHLDYVLRYIPEPFASHFRFQYDDYKEVLDAILEELVKRDKGLDVNSAALFRGKGFLNPSTEILKRFHALGGRTLTFGSDAHTPDAVAGAFEISANEVRRAGFTQYCTFTGRTKSFHSL